MKLQTSIPLKKQTKNLIDYQSKVFLLGSCFVENIGDKLSYFKFQSHQNPFGVLFHPKAIETLVERAIKEDEYTEDDVFFNNEQWHCFDAHSQMSNTSKITLLTVLNNQLQVTKQQIKEASHIVITLGTAWVYKHCESNTVVANCHKVPQSNFAKELLSVNEITDVLRNLRHKIKDLNPTVSVIFTVSPIRHIKDGFIENTQSKAHLITAIHDFILKFSNQDCYYFPSYEIMMDELRDYRFYAEDMIHPNTTAINYIWEKFQLVWLSENVLPVMEEVDAIQKGMAHKAFNPNSETHINFIRKLELKKEALQKKFQHISF